MRRVLVTGAAGFLGRHTVPLLVERGWDVHAVTSRPVAADDQPVKWYRADLLAEGEPARLVHAIAPEAILHLAWFLAPGQWAAALANLDWVPASLALVRAFGDSGGRRLVIAGSCLEYDWNHGYCSERRTPCTPHTLYGTSKHALRLLVEAYAARTGLSAAWGRVFFAYGPHEHPDRLVASVVRSLLLNTKARCSHGMQVRDYLYAGDVAGAFVELLERPDVVGPLNIASGQPITLRALVGRAAELLGRPELLEFGAIPAAPTDTALVVGDVARLTADLCWTPSYDLDRGLLATIAWWRSTMAREATTPS